MDVRNDNLTVFLLSNDPVNPTFQFLWNLKIRDYPLLTGLSAVQSANGDGLVQLAAGIADRDGEPVSLVIDRSLDNGKTWQPAALTNVLAATGTVAVATETGVLTNLLTAASDTLLTNQLSATWESRAAVPPVTVSTQALFRVAATNGYFGKSYTTARFTVDKRAARVFFRRTHGLAAQLGRRLCRHHQPHHPRLARRHGQSLH